MLVLLPEYKTPERREPLNNIMGPNINGLEIRQELLEKVRAIELGKLGAPPLLVERLTRRLICMGEHAEENLQNWTLYRLGGFSTAPVKWVELPSKERTANSAALTLVQHNHRRALVELLETPDEEVPREEDEGDPFAEWDDAPEEVEEEEEEA